MRHQPAVGVYPFLDVGQVVAYTGKDGTPRVIPVGFFWTGEQFVIATATTAPKVAALSARPGRCTGHRRG